MLRGHGYVLSVTDGAGHVDDDALGFGLVLALGAGEVPDDFLGLTVGFALDGGEGAKEQVAGVGHDSGTAGRDAAFGLMKEEAREEVVDGCGGFEVRESCGEESGEIGGPTDVVGRTGVLGAEGRRGVGDEHAAAAVTGAFLAAGQVLRPQGLSYRIGFIDDVGVRGLEFHVFLSSGIVESYAKCQIDPSARCARSG